MKDLSESDIRIKNVHVLFLREYKLFYSKFIQNVKH